MRFIACLLAFLAAACATPNLPETQRASAPILTSEEAFDEFTYARPWQARVAHVALDLTLDFDSKRVAGTATLNVIAAEDASEIVLDTDGLVIGAITDGVGNALAYEVGETDEVKGEPLTIALGDRTGPARQQIVIAYASGPEANALQWLAPEQTAGGQYPYVFSQGQAILNRTWIPTQDSPGIRQTWEARIVAPAPLNVVMSGISRGEPEALDGGKRAFEFVMDNSIPPYLIAIAAGNIEFAELGPRSGVWAEPEVLAAATAELSDTEAMIDAAEAIYGTYRWGRYDMIVLPPAFPYGGMENPVMTFLTPTFIAGDRSNTGLIAHELAHSWSGNLVTYASWRDGWLNEGVTSYLESRISEAVFGKKRAEQEKALAFTGVRQTITELGANNPLTALRNPAGISPFEANGTIYYDKGAMFLHTLEAVIGRDRFDNYMRGWFDRHAFQPATSEMFLADLREQVVQGDAELEAALMLDQWVYGTGLPENAVVADADAFAEVDAAVMAYADGRALDGAAWASWTAAEQMRFMRELPEILSAAELAQLDRELGLTQSGNNEILFLWLQAAMQNRYDPAVPQVREFLASVGRNKFVEPLFKALMDQGVWGSAIAEPLYRQTRPAYHSYTRSKVDAVMRGEG